MGGHSRGASNRAWRWQVAGVGWATRRGAGVTRRAGGQIRAIGDAYKAGGWAQAGGRAGWRREGSVT